MGLGGAILGMGSFITEVTRNKRLMLILLCGAALFCAFMVLLLGAIAVIF